MSAEALGQADVQPARATVGDPFVVTLHFTAPATYRVGVLHWSYGPDTIMQVDTVAAVLEDDSSWQARVPVAFFATGQFSGAPLDLQLVGPRGDSISILFPPESVQVASVLPADAEPDSLLPSGYKGLIHPPARVPWWAWALVVMAAAGAGAAVWWWRRPRAEKIVPAPPAAPPWEVALAALEALESRAYHRRGEPRPFATELSEIARRYLEDRYGFEALEQTTDEIRVSMRHLQLKDELRETLFSALQGCDLAKYARFHWPAPELLAALVAVRSFVQGTRPRTLQPVREP